MKFNKYNLQKFFDSEAEAANKSHEALLAFPINERCRKRKAIANVTLDKDFRSRNAEGEILLKVHAPINLADFKEGDPILLHEDGLRSGLNAKIEEIDADGGAITLAVFPMDMPSDFEEWSKKNLVIDKGLIDLRANVYNKFLDTLTPDSQYWDEHILNTHRPVSMENREACLKEVEETEKEFGLEFTPSQKQSIVNSLAAKDRYHIVGPPGTGKTWALVWLILEMMYYQKKRVIITGPNHLAINNVLKKVKELIPNTLTVKIGQTCHARDLFIEVNGEQVEIPNLVFPDIDKINSIEGPMLIGMTPHAMYTRRGRGLKADVLVIDEAGQVSIPLGVMAMNNFKKWILCGDDRQLPPIVQSKDNEKEFSHSIFEHLLNPDCTMLDKSFRMSPGICSLVSQLFYDSKLKCGQTGVGHDIKDSDPIFSYNTPVSLINVEHDGEQVSDEEAKTIAGCVKGFIERGLPASEIAVISPFRAQATNIHHAVQGVGKELKGVVSDTVDKLQGQEREVIIFSLTTGNMEYAQEMAEFLYNPQKLNVAFSRAKFKLIIVGNLSMISELGEEAEVIHKLIKILK
ncbi:MAG: AAA domain-containing protein [Bacteroidaceae bacterium]|nr:AAA domain-containing protein [Bacteroidaceae bacterium]